jgi:hypothetical protein
MAKNLSKSGILTGQDILTWHVTQSVDALTGTDAYNITISGSLDINNAPITNLTASGDISASAGIILGGVRRTTWPTSDTNLWYDGTTYLSSSVGIKVDGNITSSGNISASGNIFAQNITLYDDGVTTPSIGSSTGNLNFSNNSLHNIANITASGNISSSGTITAEHFLSSDDIVAQGNISSSGEIRGSTGSFEILETGGGSAGVCSHVFPGFSSHSGTGATTIVTIPTDSAFSYTVTATIIGSTGVPKAVGGQLIGVFNNNGGTVSLIGTQNQYIAETETGSPSFDFAVSGGDILIQVTNGSATVYKWSVHAKYIKVFNGN